MIQVDPTAPPMTAASDVSPTVTESAGELLLAYRAATNVGEEDASACVRFEGVLDWHYGYPNDEALEAHPLAGAGLEPYEFHRGPVGSFGERVWIATFHDGTFTIYARSMSVVVQARSGSPEECLISLVGHAVLRDLDES